MGEVLEAVRNGLELLCLGLELYRSIAMAAGWARVGLIFCSLTRFNYFFCPADSAGMTGFRPNHRPGGVEGRSVTNRRQEKVRGGGSIRSVCGKDFFKGKGALTPAATSWRIRCLVGAGLLGPSVGRRGSAIWR